MPMVVPSSLTVAAAAIRMLTDETLDDWPEAVEWDVFVCWRRASSRPLQWSQLSRRLSSAVGKAVKGPSRPVFPSSDLLKAVGLPGGDAHDHPASTKRFPDGGQYRIEIPSTESVGALKVCSVRGHAYEACVLGCVLLPAVWVGQAKGWDGV